MNPMELFGLWFLIAVACGFVAESKGRSAALFFLYGALFPPVALVHVLVMERTPEAIEARARAEGRAPCPTCGEMIMRTASLCPHCRRALKDGWASEAVVKARVAAMKR